MPKKKQSPKATEPGQEPIDHTDIDPTTGESVGAGLEPEGDPPAAAAPEPEPPARLPRDDAFAAILEKRREQLQRETEAARAAEPEEIAELERQAGTYVEPDEPVIEDPEVIDEPTPPEPEKPKRKQKIVVYGQEREVDEEEVLKAGIQTLQKERAADQRLEQAQQIERQVQEFQAQLATWEQNLRRGLDREGNPLTPPAAAPAKPATDPAKLREKAKAAQAAVWEGDVDKSAALMTEIFEELSQVQPAASPEEMRRLAREEWERAEAERKAREEKRAEEEFERQRQETNRVFAEEFADIAADDDLFAITANRFQRLREQHPAKPMTELAREAGTYVRERWLKNEEEPEPVPDLTARRERKTRTPAPPAAAQSARRKPPEPAAPDYSAKTYVETLRRTRRPDLYQ